MSLVFGQDTLCKHGVVGPCRDCDPYAVARRSDPETSHAAARSVEHIRRSQVLILDLLKEQGPMTDERIYRFRRIESVMSPSGARTRRAELVALGKVEAHGTERLASGRMATVWRAVDVR